MVVDHERAWHRLTAFIASKPHHGSQALLAEMTRILSTPDVVLDESTSEQLFRLFAAAQHKLRRNQDAVPDVDGGSAAGEMVAAADHELTLGGHDGHRHDSDRTPTGAAAGGRAAHE